MEAYLLRRVGTEGHRVARKPGIDPIGGQDHRHAAMDPAARSGAWIGRISCLAERNVRSGCRHLDATRRNHTLAIRFLQPARLSPRTAPAP